MSNRRKTKMTRAELARLRADWRQAEFLEALAAMPGVQSAAPLPGDGVQPAAPHITAYPAADSQE